MNLPSSLTEWAVRWVHPQFVAQALDELAAMSIATPDTDEGDNDKLEGYVQSAVRLEAPHAVPKVYLWRNNIGAGKIADGRFMRWGLANESRALNTRMKSGDLIGGRSLVITPQMAGMTVMQFVSRECKRQSWKYSGTLEENAQLAWATLINSLGGDAQIVTSTGSL